MFLVNNSAFCCNFRSLSQHHDDMSSKFGRLVDLCRRIGFVTEKTITDRNVLRRLQDQVERKYCYDYGPYGSQLRRNIIQEWWRSVLLFQDNVVSIKYDGPLLSVTEDGEQKLFCSRQNAVNYVQQYGLRWNKEIGIAQSSELLTAERFSSIFLFRGITHKFLSLHYFCMARQLQVAYSQLLKQRHYWWKRFSNNPPRFHQENVFENQKNEDIRSKTYIQYEFPWGKETIEEVTIRRLRNVNERYAADSNPSLEFIECVTTAEQAMLAYLYDAYEEDDLNQRNVLHLHSNLAPVKLMVSTEDKNSEGQLEVAKRFLKELRVAGIVCNFMENKSDSTLLQYVDETGTPFCVRINDMTTSRGIVQLRHRDTTVWESLHISEIRGRLEQILKII